jgi:hypothetical protein
MHDQKVRRVRGVIDRVVANFPITHLGILDGVAEDEAEPLEHDHKDKVQH